MGRTTPLPASPPVRIRGEPSIGPNPCAGRDHAPSVTRIRRSRTSSSRSTGTRSPRPLESRSPRCPPPRSSGKVGEGDNGGDAMTCTRTKHRQGQAREASKAATISSFNCSLVRCQCNASARSNARLRRSSQRFSSLSKSGRRRSRSCGEEKRRPASPT